MDGARIRASGATVSAVLVALASTTITAGVARANDSAGSPGVCLPEAAALVDRLDRQYGEALTAAGRDANGNLLQVYSSPEKGTWTIAVSVPGGPTCVVTSGDGWTPDMEVEVAKPGVNS